MSAASGGGREGRPRGRRHRAREVALGVLFELEDSDADAAAAFAYRCADMRAAGDVEAFARRLVEGAGAHRAQIDAAITEASANWSLEHLGKVERAVLRLGACELLLEPQTPVAVIIDESVQLAKTYAGEEAAAFVNGVLGKIASGVRV